MASLPEKLKSADVSRFVERGKAVEKYKPAVAYWCFYCAMEQIQLKGLHRADEECKIYFRDLMDKVAGMNAQYASDDAIVDKLTGQAYVEQFALETFQRADNAVRAKKATKQTIETFKASLTFFDVLDVLGTPSPEVTIKRKHAKYQILRITKAFRAGEDPNASPPTTNATGPMETPSSDQSGPNSHNDHTISHERLDENHPTNEGSGMSQSFEPQSQEPRQALSLPPSNRSQDGLLPQESPTTAAVVSPISQDPPLPSPDVQNQRHDSVGGGYFPEVHTPQVSTDAGQGLSEAGAPLPWKSPTPPSPPADAKAFYTTSSLPPDNVSPPLPESEPRTPQPSAKLIQPSNPSTIPMREHQQYRTDDRAMAEAQKHAKWAISALNFDDVSTAVKELKEALSSLGAS